MKLEFDKVSFSKAIKQKRFIELMLTMQEAANEAHISKATFSRCEGGSEPDVNTFGNLCAWLGISADTFFIPAKEKA